MKKITFETKDTVHIDTVSDAAPVFAKFNGKLYGMLVKGAEGWGLRTGGGSRHSHGNRFPTRSECLSAGNVSGYEFFTP